MPVACCTPRTVTVTTKPVSETAAAIVADTTAVAVSGEYCSTARSLRASNQYDELGEDEPAEAGDQRHQPQAALDVLADRGSGDPSS